ncbi:MAG TPA: hypothetical protein VFA46_02795 [Actinomycetes bacterium]|jgi:hypothetical protein|nr:hypothetical protein [Actinomycetes bacterium]
MTAVIPNQPLTTSVLLFGETRDTGQALAQALDEKGVLGSLAEGLQPLSQAGRQAAARQVATVASGLLGLDLGDLVVAGWRKQATLAAAAKHTIDNPGSSEVVELATHRITSVHRPLVRLLIDDVHVATVHFELCIEFVVKALGVTVYNGHVVGLHSGACDVTATLSAEGVQLARRQQHFELPVLVRWPLRLHLGGDGPRPDSARRPPASSPSLRPSTPTNHPVRRQRRRHLVRRAWPAD